MIRTFLGAVCLSTLLSSAVYAQEIKVVTSIKPLHGLVEMILGDTGMAIRMVPNGISPHDATLRPSDRRHMEQADLVVLIDRHFETNYARALREDEQDKVLEISQIPGMMVLNRRVDTIAIDEHDDDHHDDEHHDDHRGHAHDDHGDHDDHDDHHAHDDSPYDLHLWLSPDNGVTILDAVATRLTKLYPEHGGEFARNAMAAKEQIKAADADVRAKLEPFRGQPFIVYHDAYAYFEETYGLNMAASILGHHDAATQAKRVRALREKVSSGDVGCIFHEPQFSKRILKAIDPDGDANHVSLDPIGEHLQEGKTLYPSLLRSLADSITECLS